MIKPVKNTIKFCVILLVICVYLLLTIIVAEAAVLYLETNEYQYYKGDTFIAEIRLNTEGEYINTVKVNLNFPKDLLEVRDFSQGNSVLTLWIETPSTANIDTINREGLVSFSGGIPAGYQGWDGLLGRIVFRVRETPTPNLGVGVNAKVEFLESSKVLLNDGFGTEAGLKREEAILMISQGGETKLNEWQEELKKDNTSPEAFEINLNKDPSLFEGKYFVIFSTNDKQSGVDHYETLEADTRGYQRGTTQKAVWKKAESPYLLEDQSLQSIIKVKAVDKAGNEIIALLEPLRASKNPIGGVWFLGIVLGAIGVIIWGIIKRFKVQGTRCKGL